MKDLEATEEMWRVHEELADLLEQEKRSGVMVAVCKSPDRIYPKYPQEMVYVGPHGVEGDAHTGELRRSYTNPSVMKSNDRAISIVADEVREQINNELGFNIQPGHFCENLLIKGIGDLSDFKGGERLVFSSGVILQITEQNFGCQKLEEFNGKGLIKALIKKDESGEISNKRGLVGTVLKPGELRPGDTFIVQNDIVRNVMTKQSLPLSF